MKFELRDNEILIGTGEATQKEQIAFLPKTAEKLPGYTIEPYKFLGEKGANADGVLFTIAPLDRDGMRNSIGIVRNLNDTVFQEAVIEGSGWWLGQSPDGEVRVHEVRWDEVGTVIEWGGKGWVNTWIAGDRGARILDITEPKFVPEETEEELAIDDSSVSKEFWNEYHRLRRGRPDTETDTGKLRAIARFQRGENPEAYLYRVMEMYHEPYQKLYLQALWNTKTMADLGFRMIGLIMNEKRIPQKLRNLFPTDLNPNLTPINLKGSSTNLVMDRDAANKAIRSFNIAVHYGKKHEGNDTVVSLLSGVAKMLPGPYRLGEVAAKQIKMVKEFENLGIHPDIGGELQKAILSEYGLDS